MSFSAASAPPRTARRGHCLTQCPAALCCLVLVAQGCDGDRAPSPAASASAIVITPSPSASAEPEAPWYVGTWKGSFETEPHRVDLDKKQGAPEAWTAEELPTDGVGKVELSVTIDPERNVAGTARGALGELDVRGHLDGEALKARLVPRGPDSFHGTLVAKRKDDALAGELRASRGDSLALSQAEVSLAKSAAP